MEAQAEATVAKVKGGEGTIVVKHPEPLREEDDGGDILQIRWCITSVYVTEVKEETTTTIAAMADLTEEATTSMTLFVMGETIATKSFGAGKMTACDEQ